MRTISFASVAAERKKTAGTIPAAIAPEESRSPRSLGAAEDKRGPRQWPRRRTKATGRTFLCVIAPRASFTMKTRFWVMKGPPTGMIIRPPFLSWRRRGGGTCPPAQVTMMASNGAFSSQP